MPTIKYPKNPNIDTAFVEQEDGTKNRALMIAPQDISTLELPNNPNSTKGYITVDGKKQRVILTADITGGGGGGSSLPDQTGHSGEFLTTDGTDASWSDKPLVNKATGTDSLAVLGTATAQKAAVFGNGAQALNLNGGSNSCAFGYKAITNATRAIQIGTGTNSNADTFKVANSNGNYEMMSADGTIPTARLTKVNTTITLAAADWSSNTQTVSVTGMTATGVVMVSPDPTDQSAYTSAGIICSAQAAGTLTFTCSTTPTADLSVNVVML